MSTHRLKPHSKVELLLLKFARAIAKDVCKQFKLKPRAIELFDHDDPDRLGAWGECHPNGVILLEFCGKNPKHFAKISTIIDTVVHELAHLIDHGEDDPHGPKFWEKHREMMKWTQEHLIEG